MSNTMPQKNTSKKIALALLLISVAPSFASAQATDFKGVVSLLIGLIQSLIPLVVALTLLVFIWGVFQLVRSNSEDSRKEALGIITYGVVSLFVMVSVWGLVAILTSTFFAGQVSGFPQLK
jgi:ABC-type nickel/cobalt efflux system permease component RcnA